MQSQNSNRRSFIKNGAVGGLLAISIPEILSAAMLSKGTMEKHSLMKDSRILFQGDSITDYDRDKGDNSYNTPKALGSGYTMLSAAALLEKYASLNLKIFNKGISGNRVDQLAGRWDKDCLEIKPDILSILVGVNDLAHTLHGTYKGSVEIYKNNFTALLERTKKALPDCKLIIGEPFAISGINKVDGTWYPEFYGYQKVAHDIAVQFGAVFIPYQKIYDEAQKRAPGVYWIEDGIHPTLAGAQLMAHAWLETIK